MGIYEVLFIIGVSYDDYICLLICVCIESLLYHMYVVFIRSGVVDGI